MRASYSPVVLMGGLFALLACGKSLGTGGAGGGGAGTGGCEPGENIFCRCPGGEAGTKRCRADAVSFEACVTKDGPCPPLGAGGSGGATTSSTVSTSTTGTGGAPPGGTLLVVAGGADVASTFRPGGAWATAPIGVPVAEAALATRAQGGAALVARRRSAVAAEDGELIFAAWSEGQGFGAAEPLGVKALGRPSLASQGDDSVAVFLGTDHKHGWAALRPGALGPVAPLPADAPGTQAFGPSPAAVLARGGGSGVFAAYVGDDGRLYTLDKPAAGGDFGPSTLVALSSPAAKALPPALAADDMRDFFYVRQNDGRICLSRVEGASVVGAETLHDLALTGESPSVARAPGGDLVVAWHGFDDGGIYFLRGKPGAWGAPVTVDLPVKATSAPVVVAGLGGADAEILYLRGGALEHARVVGTKVVSTEEVGGVSGATSVAAVVLP